MRRLRTLSKLSDSASQIVKTVVFLEAALRAPTAINKGLCMIEVSSISDSLEKCYYLLYRQKLDTFSKRSKEMVSFRVVAISFPICKGVIVIIRNLLRRRMSNSNGEYISVSIFIPFSLYQSAYYSNSEKGQAISKPYLFIFPEMYRHILLMTCSISSSIVSLALAY